MSFLFRFCVISEGFSLKPCSVVYSIVAYSLDSVSLNDLRLFK